jgi:hypothetical protein
LLDALYTQRRNVKVSHRGGGRTTYFSDDLSYLANETLKLNNFNMPKFGDNVYSSSSSTEYIDIDLQRLLVGVGKYKYFKPTLKTYLVSQVRSRIIEITPRGWTMCFFLPIAKFAKKSESSVHKESAKKV